MASAGVSTDNYLAKAYHLQDAAAAEKLYDEWAESFDSDVTGPSQNYVAPMLVAQAVVAAHGNVAGAILDAGCGTGLGGVALQRVGARTIDGVDLSRGMLAVARKTGAYRDLAAANLLEPLDQPDGKYDVVTCIGTFTQTHVGPVPAMREFVRVTVKGGLIVSTILDSIWLSDGFKAEVDQLVAERLVQVVSNDIADYRPGAGVRARLLVLRKS